MISRIITLFAINILIFHCYLIGQSNKIDDFGIYLDIIEEYLIVPIVLGYEGKGIDRKRGTPYINNVLIYEIEDYYGGMKFEIYNDRDQKKLYLIGSYIGNPDTMKSMIAVINPKTLLEEYMLIEYFHPLRNGKWEYYNEDGSVRVIEVWDKGKLITILDPKE